MQVGLDVFSSKGDHVFIGSVFRVVGWLAKLRAVVNRAELARLAIGCRLNNLPHGSAFALQLKGAPALSCSALAGRGRRSPIEVIVDGQFLAGLNVTQAHV